MQVARDLNGANERTFRLLWARTSNPKLQIVILVAGPVAPLRCDEGYVPVRLRHLVHPKSGRCDKTAREERLLDTVLSPLRPLSVSDLIDETFQLYRR